MNNDDDLPTPRLPLTRQLTLRPVRPSLSVNGTRVGTAARPIADGAAPIGTLRSRRFGLRAHLTTLPLPEKPSDEVA